MALQTKIKNLNDEIEMLEAIIDEAKITEESLR